REHPRRPAPDRRRAVRRSRAGDAVIARALVGGELLLIAAIVTGLLTLQTFRRLSRCCMSARTVIAQDDQPHRIEDMPGHLEAVRHLSDPGEHETYWDIAEQLLND